MVLEYNVFEEIDQNDLNKKLLNLLHYTAKFLSRAQSPEEPWSSGQSGLL